MKNINRCFISGNLTRDAELKKTKGGLSVLRIPVASNESRKNAAGEWTDYPNYFDCVIMGERADKLASALTKGTKVFISGSMRYSTWMQDDRKASKIEIICDQIEIPYKPAAKQTQGQAQADYYDEILF